MHGRECYRRNSYATYYIFFKNILYTAPVFWFGINSNFSGTMIYDFMLYVTYNTFYTAVPVIWYATFDFQYSKEFLLKSPGQYKYGIRNLHFNKALYFKTVMWALFESWFIMFFTY